MKKFIKCLLCVICLLNVGVGINAEEKEETEVTVEPRGSVAQHFIISGYCGFVTYVIDEFYGDFEIKAKLTGSAYYIRDWRMGEGMYYYTRYTDIEGREYIPYIEGQYYNVEKRSYPNIVTACRVN